MSIEADQFIEECLKLKDTDNLRYSLFVHGGIIPTLEKDRKDQ